MQFCLGFSSNKVRTAPENWLSYAPSPSFMPGVVTKARYVRAGERGEAIALGQWNLSSSKISLVTGMLMSAIADNETLECVGGVKHKEITGENKGRS